jgi:hypothetical protein
MRWRHWRRLWKLAGSSLTSGVRARAKAVEARQRRPSKSSRFSAFQ